jgi:MerR family transcriptional regulator, redox-sensitive transcriptional activator SoxR
MSERAFHNAYLSNDPEALASRPARPRRIGATSRLGDVMEILGLTARAIRFYEERGLISPHRDRLNRRLFDNAMVRTLELIGQLRSVGIGIDEIGALMAQTAPCAREERIHRLISMRRQELTTQLAALQRLEDSLGAIHGGAPS